MVLFFLYIAGFYLLISYEFFLHTPSAKIGCNFSFLSCICQILESKLCKPHKKLGRAERETTVKLRKRKGSEKDESTLG